MQLNSGESIFRYPLTRPYPYRWFTWAAIIGGIIFTVLFTFVALAADGYNSQVLYTSDLNDTLSQHYWFDKAPFSWFGKTTVSCESALLTPGSSYYTSNLGLVYSLNRIYQAGQSGVYGSVLPAAPYRNYTLEDCEVQQINIDLERSDTTRLPKNYWSWQQTSASATAACTLNTYESGPLRVQLLTQLPMLKNADRLLDTFLSLNLTTSANMWFGAQFLHSWYGQLSPAMGYSAPVDSPTDSFGSGAIALTRNPGVNDYTSLEFFQCDTTFGTDNGGLVFMHTPSTIADWADQSSTDNNGNGFHLPNISETVDAFGKTFYSLILSDLGVTTGDNALITPAGVQYLQTRNDTSLAIAANSSTMGQGVGLTNVLNVTATVGGFPIETAYQTVTKALGQPPVLNTTNSSTIFTQYLCSVPKRKSGGSLFFSVLIADIVFLQAFWNLFNKGTQWWLQSKDPQMDYCAACKSSISRDADGVGGKSGDRYELLSNRADGGLDAQTGYGGSQSLNSGVDKARAKSRSSLGSS